MAFHFTPTPYIVCKFIHEPTLTPPLCFPALISTTLVVHSAPLLILTHITCMFSSGPMHCLSSYWNVLQLSTWLFLSLPQVSVQMPLYWMALLWPPLGQPLYSALSFPIALLPLGILCMSSVFGVVSFQVKV